MAAQANAIMIIRMVNEAYGTTRYDHETIKDLPLDQYYTAIALRTHELTPAKKRAINASQDRNSD